MSDPPRRPTLSLKFPPPPRPEPEPPRPIPTTGSKPAKPFAKRRAPQPEPPPPPAHDWKCRPCGTGFDVAADLADEDFVRCPACNARLGRAGDFRTDPPNLEKLRARPGRKA